MSGASHLNLSPKALRRISNLIRGRQAYLVPGLASEADVEIADFLGIPMLSPEPQIAQLYSSKSGAKRIFQAAGVASPPGEYDIYSLQQLEENLSQLITRNIKVQRWLLKIDQEFHGRGIAVVDVSAHLPCYQWANREADRYGENWKQSWAQEQVLMKVTEQVFLVASFQSLLMCYIVQ